MTTQEFYKKYKVFEVKGLLGLKERDTNRIVIMPNCQSINPVKPYYDNDTLYLKVKIKGKYSLCNLSGKQISEEYDYIGDYSKGVISFSKNFIWGFLNAEGKVLIQPKFKTVERIVYGKFKVKVDNKWGIVSESGLEVQPIYERIFIGYEKIQGTLNGKTEEIKF